MMFTMHRHSIGRTNYELLCVGRMRWPHALAAMRRPHASAAMRRPHAAAGETVVILI